jgi:hypothetical protein
MAARESGARSPEKVLPYRCFLVRCRLEENAVPTGKPAWRFTVQQAGAGGARHSFTCFDDVAAHMQAELASCGALAADGTESEAATQGRPTSQKGVLP